MDVPQGGGSEWAVQQLSSPLLQEVCVLSDGLERTQKACVVAEGLTDQRQPAVADGVAADVDIGICAVFAPAFDPDAVLERLDVTAPETEQRPHDPDAIESP